jgi:predicted Rossmann fold flavoprotein
MCAIEAGKRGRKVIVLDHANKAGKKILMSGGGRCNFTNYHITADNYISHNPHFCKSALSRYTQWDFIAMVEAYRIPYHEKALGQLFCDNSAKDILNMLLAEADNVGAKIILNCDVGDIDHDVKAGFNITTSQGDYCCKSLVIASGGLSIPKMCASPIGYKLATQFGLRVWPTSAGLVPFTLQPDDKARYASLSGIAVDCLVSNKRISFRENLLFTHRGLSGPAMLQISSYWKPGETIEINLLPDTDLLEKLLAEKRHGSQSKLKTVLALYIPKRVLAVLLEQQLADSSFQDLSHQRIAYVISRLQHWKIKPNGTEGYRTAEVTIGGVDCNDVSSKTMEARKVPGLYFIGEVLDVTGWLGGYNFQWAWSSGWCAGQVV